MAKILLLLFILGIAIQFSFAQKKIPVYKPGKYSAAQVTRELDDMDAYIIKNHPGFYRYTSKPDFDRFIDSIKSTIKDSLTEIETYRKFKPIIAQINCLHTDINISPKYTDWLNTQPNLFPFQVYCKGDRAFIIKNFSGNDAITPGDEIKSINGQPIAEIIPVLLHMISSDGHNQTLKYLELYYNFPAKYRESINVTENFSVTVLHNNSPVTYEVKGARFKDIATDWFLKPKEYRRKLEFTMLDNTGLLTLHSFDEPDVKEGGQIFDKYIDSVFHQLNTKGVTDLIIDLRNNDGGEDSHAAYLTRHFFDAPFRYWDRIEVTEGFARSFNKKNFVELNAPIQKDTAWILPKAKKTTEFDFYETQQPAKEIFKGKVYVLINGFCESSCADIAAILSYNKKAVMIGEETGGGFQGNNSGITPEGVRVMPMNFPLDVPLQKYFNYVDPKLNVDRGVMPDYPVELSVEELIKGEDKVLGVVLEMIRKQTK